MTAGDGLAFSFALNPPELREATRIAQKHIHQTGHFVLWRAVEIVVMALTGALLGLVVGPAFSGRLRLATPDQVALALAGYFCVAIGVWTERVCMRRILTPLLRRQRAVLAAPRVVSLGAWGLQVEVADSVRRQRWGSLARAVRGRHVLVLLMIAGEWLAIPLRVLPDGGAGLERDIAAWRAAYDRPALAG